MYVTAQRVFAPATGKAGINVFLHAHQPGELPHPLDLATARRVAESCPGKQVAQVLGLRPGGNRILSYLDIIAADDEPPATIGQALTAIAEDASVGWPKVPLEWLAAGVAIRFEAVTGLYEQNHAEFKALAEAAMALLRCAAR